jgi:4-amino-4-deoxy-L-arabinose transferase-like glycosyltransferase
MRSANYRIPILLLLIGAAFRFHALAQDFRFHPDEALFSTFARSAAVNGDWLLHGPLDKTPLTIYASALSMLVFGVRSMDNGVLTLDIRTGEFVARLPGTLASIMLVAVVYRLARDLYCKGESAIRLYTYNLVPNIAMLLMALSPFAIAFSAGVFTDGLMLLWLALALMMMARGRWGWSGVFLALGFASKQQALLFVPLLVAVGWALDKDTIDRVPTLRKYLSFALSVIITFTLLVAWDVARAQPGGIWGLAAANNNPDRLIRANEILPRLTKWFAFAQTFVGPGWLTGLLALVGIGGLTASIIHQPRRRATLIDVILLTYGLGYGLLHWLIALNTYDRYLLPVLPLVILLIARGLEKARNFIQRYRAAEQQRKFGYHFASLILCVSVLGVLGFAALAASEGRIELGDDRSEYRGIDQLTDFLNSRALGAIVYDRWLGWELGYYMGAWSDKRRVYYPTPDSLVSDALLQTEAAPRYFPAPAGQPIRPWLNALNEAGFTVHLVYDQQQFVVYEIIPANAGA